MCFPSLGFRHKDNLKVILRHYCISAASLEKIYSCILGGVTTIRLIILNINPSLHKELQ